MPPTHTPITSGSSGHSGRDHTLAPALMNSASNAGSASRIVGPTLNLRLGSTKRRWLQINMHTASANSPRIAGASRLTPNHHATSNASAVQARNERPSTAQALDASASGKPPRRRRNRRTPSASTTAHSAPASGTREHHAGAIQTRCREFERRRLGHHAGTGEHGAEQIAQHAHARVRAAPNTGSGTQNPRSSTSALAPAVPSAAPMSTTSDIPRGAIARTKP